VGRLAHVIEARSGAGDPVVGIDGARGGWVGVRWDGVEVSCTFAVTLADLVEEVWPVAVVAVDMPIELEASTTRACEDLARPLLGARRSSLFQSPSLGALDFADDDYPAANAWSKATTGRGISKQAWFLVPKIREVRALTRACEVPVRECMPELSFRSMHGGPLAHAKTTWSGQATRLRLLREQGIELPDDPGPAGRVAPDDLLDAAAVAWSARRIADGTAECVPTDGTPEAAIWW
jgi:predicted RNase H-like nuclease